MNCSRIYLRIIGKDGPSQQNEVARSAPNEPQPTATYEIPPEYDVRKVTTVAGYGNTDTYIEVEPIVDEPKVAPTSVVHNNKVATELPVHHKVGPQ
jgi:hypothetical protein